MEYYNAFNSISVYPHHIKQNICGSRAKYRDGKKDTAVKVYTINQESKYIIITNVPAVGGSEELHALCNQYGIVDEFQPLDDYPCEEFTEAYLIKYDSFPSARSAKRYLDDKSFLGSVLHVFYGPEFETVDETRMKLQERRNYVFKKTKRGQNVPQIKPSVPQSQSNKLVKPSYAERHMAAQPATYIWAGKEYTLYPNGTASASAETVTEDKGKKDTTTNLFLPRQLKQKPSDGSCSSTNTNEVQGLYSSNTISHVQESSYLNTISHVRNKISNVSVPNVRKSLKRKRKI